MDLRSELLKSIWYAFTSLDVEKCGKVSKSQLKVSRSRAATRRAKVRAGKPKARELLFNSPEKRAARVASNSLKVFKSAGLQVVRQHTRVDFHMIVSHWWVCLTQRCQQSL